MTDKLHIAYEMEQFDTKNREFFDQLSDEERKKITMFTMIRWGSVVAGDYDTQAYYLMSVNERLNKHFFDVSTTQHKKLQWLLATTVSPGIGKFRHNWLAAPKRASSNNKAEKFFAEIYPHAKSDEIKMLATINDKNDIKELARAHGWDERRIKDYI
jgi:hypothetical protein